MLLSMEVKGGREKILTCLRKGILLWCAGLQFPHSLSEILDPPMDKSIAILLNKTLNIQTLDMNKDGGLLAGKALTRTMYVSKI